MELDKLTYRLSKRSLERFPELITQQREQLAKLGLTPEEIQRVLDPTISFMEGVREDVEQYEQMQHNVLKVELPNPKQD